MSNLVVHHDAENQNDEEDDDFTVWQNKLRSWFLPTIITITIAIVGTLGILLLLRSKNKQLPSRQDGSMPIVIGPGDRGTWNNIYLPEHIRPFHYDLHFGTILNSNSTNSSFIFGGKAQIHLNITQATSFIVIHAVDLKLQNVSLVSEVMDLSSGLLIGMHPIFNASEVYPVKHEYHPSRQYHVFSFSKKINPGIHLFKLNYLGNLSRELRGYYVAKYNTGQRTGVLATTQFEPADARRGFPCFDEPKMKATFSLTLRTQEQYHALSNMPIDKKKANSSLQSPWSELPKEFNFARTPKMSTYLVAFVVSDFVSTNPVYSNSKVPVSVWTPPGQSQLGEYAARSGATILDYYEKLFKIRYPLPKLDLISIPDFAAGAMENWGLVTFRDTALLLGKTGTPTNQQRVSTVVAHELAHQWFGNLVTTITWNSLYLQEGFAQFCEYLGTNATEPTFMMMEQFYHTTQVRAMMSDSSPLTHAIHANVSDPSEIESMFDAISYSKGASLIRMVQDYLSLQGADFFELLRKYLLEFSYSNADSKDLWSALSIPGLNLTEILVPWIYKPGFPVVSIDVKSISELTISQKRCFDGHLNGTLKPSSAIWSIPFTYQIYSNASGIPLAVGSRKSMLFKESSETINLPIDIETELEEHPTRFLIKPNVGQAGFYRFMLPSSMIDTAASWLLNYPDSFNPLDRAGLLEDTLDAFMRGDLPITASLSALNMLEFLPREISFSVWNVALDRLQSILSHLELDPSLPIVKKKILSLTETIINSLGWKETNNDPTTWHVRALLRSEVLSLAGKLDHTSTITRARQLFSSWIISGEEEPAVGLRPVIVDIGVRLGGDDEYLAVENQFKRSTLASESNMFLHGLAQTRSPHLILRNMDHVLSGRIRSQDRSRFLTWVLNSSPSAPILIWAYVQENWARIVDSLGTGGAFASISEFIEALAGRSSSSEEAIRSIESFFSHPERNQIPGIQQSLRRGIDHARKKLEWNDIYNSKIVLWASKP